MDNSNVTEIDVLPREAIVDISISGAFYERLQNCLYALLNTHPDGQAGAAVRIKELDSSPPETLWDEQVLILLSLIYTIDQNAITGKLTIKDDIINYLKSDDSAQETSLES